MIISNSKMYVFIHIPKCGGTTISNVLERRLRPQDVSLAVNPHAGWAKFVDTFKEKFGLFKHSTAKEIAEAMGPKYFQKYFIFAFCRNPFARAYSAFTFTKSADAKHRPDSKRYQDIKDMNFEEFLASKYMQERKIFPAAPQSQWIKGAPKKVELFKLEEVDQALDELMKKFYGPDAGIDNLPRANFSAGKEEWKTMSKTAEKMIVDIYHDDFETLDYPAQIER